MQIVKFHLNQDNFYCPLSGQKILSPEGINENVPIFMGYWLDEYWSEPTIKGRIIEAKWNHYIQLLKSSEASIKFSSAAETIEKFFESIDIEGGVIFKIYDNFPKSPTLYLLLELSTTIEAENP